LASATGSRFGAEPPALVVDLATRVHEALANAEELLGLELAGGPDPLGLAFLAAVERVRSAHDDAPELCDLLVDIQALQQELARAETPRTNLPLAGLREALSRLRGLRSPRELLDHATAELCGHCGFDRAALFRLDGSALVLENVYVAGMPETAAEFLEVARLNPPRLDHMLLETEMIRRGCAILVTDAANDPRTYKPLVAAARARSYVAAPIMPSGRVIGFLHADHNVTGRPVDEVDRDVIAAFAEGLGFAAERTVLLDRMNLQRRRIEAQMSTASALLRDCAESEITLAPAATGSAPGASPRALTELPPESRLDSLLTRREAEVLALMAEGSTNLAIAERLVISEGTVKSHVKSILRKLRAANRAEAVSRYMKLRSGLA
jgi:DNA-binding CsgD family transcriptional regulator